MAGPAGTTGKKSADPVAITVIATVTTNERGTEATMAAATIADKSIVHPTTASTDTTDRTTDPILVRIRTRPRTTPAVILVRMPTQPRATTAATLARTADTAEDVAEVCSNPPEYRAIGPRCSGSERFAEPETTVATPARRAVLCLYSVVMPDAPATNRHRAADAGEHDS